MIKVTSKSAGLSKTLLDHFKKQAEAELNANFKRLSIEAVGDSKTYRGHKGSVFAELLDLEPLQGIEEE